VFPPPAANESLTEADRSALVATGMFIHANPSDPVHHGKGKVSVYVRAVFLENDFEVGPGPAFHVYLVPKSMIRANGDLKEQMYVDLGGLRAFKGSQRYAIPAGVELKNYPARSVSRPASRRPSGVIRRRCSRTCRGCSSGPATTISARSPGSSRSSSKATT
jgi:hypothetical protein